MPTQNPRGNITFEPDLLHAVQLLAKQESKSVSFVAKELIIDALERREDIALSAIAELRDNEKGKLISHEDAWK